MYVQFSDLIELNISSIATPTYTGGRYVWPDLIKPLEFKTEFIFGTLSRLSLHLYDKYLSQMGFERISSMINWSPLHTDTRIIDLFWLKNPNPTSPNRATRTPWSGSSTWLSKHCQATGCGFKVLDCELQHRRNWRFHALMRMPIMPSPRQLWWLNRFHYRHIATGKLSSYWTNGWVPKEYTTEKELRYWRDNKVHLLPIYPVKFLTRKASVPWAVNYVKKGNNF